MSEPAPRDPPVPADEPAPAVGAPSPAEPAAAPDPAPATRPAGVAFCGEHPESPAVSTCTRCGTFACEACTRAMPDGQAFCAACHARGAGAIAWEQRKRLGWWRAFWQTTREVSLRPKRFFRTPQHESGILAPFFYNTGIQAVGQIGTALTLMVVYGSLGLLLAATLPPGRRDEANVIILIAFIVPAVVGFLGILQAPVNAIWGMAIGGGLAHLGLIVVRAKRVGFEATARALAYAQAPMVIYLVPVLGFLLGPWWTLWVSVVALRETHETSTWRAFLALLLFPVFLLLALTAATVAFVLISPVLFRE